MKIENHKRRGQAGGFTMVELLVVILILSILVGLVVAVSKYVNDEAAKKTTKATQEIIKSALNAYYTATDGYPTAPIGTMVSQLTNATTVPDCAKAMQALPKGALTAGTVIDGWGHEMRYVANGGFGGTPVVISAGPDGKMDTDADNIRSDK